MYPDRIGKERFDLEYACNVYPLGNLLVDLVVPFPNSLEAGTVAGYLHKKFSGNRYLPQSNVNSHIHMENSEDSQPVLSAWGNWVMPLIGDY